MSAPVMLPARPVAELLPLPRRTALVPERLDDEVVDVDPPPRDVALEPEDDEPLEDEEEDDEPELDPDELDPLDGGAERTGCCSEYDGAE
jgi:hypothetical protein